jgi:hypothetical protein
MGQAFSFRTTPAARFVPGSGFSHQTVAITSDACPPNQGSALPRTTVLSAAAGGRNKTQLKFQGSPLSRRGIEFNPVFCSGATFWTHPLVRNRYKKLYSFIR